LNPRISAAQQARCGVALPICAFKTNYMLSRLTTSMPLLRGERGRDLLI